MPKPTIDFRSANGKLEPWPVREAIREAVGDDPQMHLEHVLLHLLGRIEALEVERDAGKAAGRFTPLQAATALANLLRPRGWLVSVGVGGTAEQQVLYVYTTTAAGKKVAEHELAGKYAGYPVSVERMGRVKACSA